LQQSFRERSEWLAKSHLPSTELTATRSIRGLALSSKGNHMQQTPRTKLTLNIVLWVMQALLALAFLNAGYLKTFKPIQEIAPTIFWAPSLPEPLVRLIGFSELLGGVGLVLLAFVAYGRWKLVPFTPTKRNA
jgi:hypothetical protein